MAATVTDLCTVLSGTTLPCVGEWRGGDRRSKEGGGDRPSRSNGIKNNDPEGSKNWNPSLREKFLSSLHLFWDLPSVLSITATQRRY